MKRTRAVAKPREAAEPSPRVMLSDEGKNTHPIDSNLSPERMMEGSSTTTTLLSQILAQQDALPQWRDWGINE